MPEDTLPASLQESLLALLAFNDKFGTAVAAQVTPNHFDAPYQEIATKLLSYRREYGRAPTRAHLDDIFAKELAKTDSRTRKLLIGLNTLDNVGFNAEYVANRVQHHIRRQTLKSAIMRAGEFYQSGGEENIEQVEQVLYAALRTRHVGLTPGIRLSEASKLLSFLDHKDPDFTLGIPALDKIGFGVSAKELLLYIAPKGCLVGSTLIDCPRDLAKHPLGIPIKELVGKQFATYSWDFEQNKPCISKVLDVWCSGIKPVYRVTLFSSRQKLGKKGGGTRRAKYLPPLELVGTFDHPVLLSDGTWRKLGELQPGDSLKSLYRRVESKNSCYCRLTWTGTVTSVREHQFICDAVHGPRPGTGKEFHTHHKNENSFDNVPDNLEWKPSSDHFSDHLADRNRRGTAGWLVTGVHPRGMKDKCHKEETKKRQREAAIEITKTRKRDPSSGKFINHTVISVKKLGVRAVYDMEVERTSNFVANGVFVHNSGKSWFGVHMGRIGIQHRAKVLHLSLEWPQERILGRYCQSLFGVGSRGDAYARTAFEYDDLKKLAGWETKRQRPRLNFNSPDIRKFFQDKFKQWGARFGTLIIKDFPSGSLTITQLNAYLDYLEQFERFIPTLVIVDYPDLMKQDARDLRVSIGRTVVDLRGMASERNFALICPTQGGRSSIGAKHVKSKDIAEDISKVWTADSVLTYSRTEAEEARGLARLSVQHARNTVGGHEVVISQAYSIGQYVLDSALMSKAYWDQMKGENGEEDE